MPVGSFFLPVLDHPVVFIVVCSIANEGHSMVDIGTGASRRIKHTTIIELCDKSETHTLVVTAKKNVYHS